MQDQGRMLAAVERLADGVDRLVPRGLPPVRRHDRPLDAVGLQVPRTMPLTGFLTAIPGLAGQFERTVPEEYVDRAEAAPVVRCPCGTSTPLDMSLTRCGGDCSRFFLVAGPREVRVAGPYPDDEPEQAAAA